MIGRIIFYFIPYLLLIVQVSAHSQQSTAGEALICGSFVVFDPTQSEIADANADINLKIGSPIEGIYYNAKYLDDIEIDIGSMSFSKIIQIERPSLIFIRIDGRHYNLYAEPNAEINLRIVISNGHIITIEDIGTLGKENNFLLTKSAERRPIYFRLMRYAQQFNESSDEFRQKFLDSCRMNLDYYVSSLDSLSRSDVISTSFIDLAKAQLTYNALSVPFHQLLNQPTEPSNDFDLSLAEVIDTFFCWVGVLDSTKLGIDCPIYYSVFVDGPNIQSKNPLDYPEFAGYARRMVLPEPFDRLAIFNALSYEYQNGSPTVSFREAAQLYADVFIEDGLYFILDSLNNLMSHDTILYQDLANDTSDSLRTYFFGMYENHVTEGYSQSFQSFEELVKSAGPVPSRLWFVDFWATWCKPCIEEFQYSGHLVDNLKHWGVGVLYLSIDKKDKIRQWESIVRTNNLGGMHYLLSENLQRQIREQLHLHTIPRYVLVDDRGQVVLNNASRPSELTKLIEQIETILRK